MDEKARTKHLTPEVAPLLTELAGTLKALEPFAHDTIEKAFNDLVTAKGIKLGKLAQPVRVALTGGTVSPGIHDVIEVMGKDKVLKRIEAAVDMIKG
jgi:glutamyl-tRNA synthetase